ncbi:uncharacterized protein LOC103315480 isoform X1 [Nasonia vitripennis]|uniref:F-box domain-containing protein n=1 Tax=Nasonia vitripennis TaxID=7425 RepID=A0A7M7LQC7_NASVI|nr:uncharacterized protein LOC103315480 isoform X1 [Nasonia vitripennis]XP_008202779.1 uncharacterized protein LOC103315480 isoform X1 [Nasonia vitripennis]XP_008202789.1 uncharacterized protein LOC103315480 isoform X1 [Nasonia vitripennis]XP_031777584.1 uncharacterized protein LOC103315480 isoform X1 [Nasonia vitripennis]XP_031777585.1 uncharacterized protein LOC103315480 isoform X1 [Nasonia vitripennis]
MDPEHEQKEEISAEFALHDAMDCILQYLNTRDLCRAAQVSRAWNEAVKLEFSRRGPEIVRLPDTYDSRLTNANGPKFFASNELRSKPEFTLMLCGPTPRTRIYLNVETSLMTAYKPHLPGRLMIIAVDAAMLDAEEIKSCPRSMSAEFAKTNGIVAFLLPKFRQVQIKVGFCASHTDRPSKRAKRVVHSIMPDDWNSESTILLFGRIYYTIHEHVLSTIKKKFKPNSYTVWGGSTSDYIKIIDCLGDEYPSYMGMEGCVAINFSGIERHSAVIAMNQRVSGFESDVAEFAKGLKPKLKRCNKGLICGPRNSVHEHWTRFREKCNYTIWMNIVKKYFPNVTFMGFFNVSDLHYIGMNTGQDDADQKMLHELAVSILILTHD